MLKCVFHRLCVFVLNGKRTSVCASIALHYEDEIDGGDDEDDGYYDLNLLTCFPKDRLANYPKN